MFYVYSLINFHQRDYTQPVATAVVDLGFHGTFFVFSCDTSKKPWKH